MKNRRRKKIIDLKTQSMIAIEVMTHALILPILIIIFVAIDPFSTIFSEMSAETHFIAAYELFEINADKWPFFLLLMIFIGFLSIVFSHHIAGPALRFKKTFSEMLDKNFTHRIKLRRFDYLQEMSLDFNKLMDNLSGELKAIQESGDEISKIVDESLKKGSADKNSLDEIASKSKNIGEILNKYEL